MEDAFDCFEKLARKRKVQDAAVQKKKWCMGTGFILGMILSLAKSRSGE